MNDMETLEDIWTDLGARVRGFVGRRVSDEHAADDIAQDVMLKVHSQLDARPSGDKLPAWVFAVARNAVIDHYRARAVRDHADIADVEPVADPAHDEQQEMLRDLTPCLMRMVEQLPEPYREAMKLADLEGLSQQEVADRVGISLSGAKSRVQRGRAMLREMIYDCCKIERDGRGNVMDYETTERSGRYCGDRDDRPKCGDSPV
jgi:RNA polymerase sigma-70 factor (ECF subfamily)